jgi:ubiquinone/menaquinone biosynthesis C-methylase UbiE
MGKHGYTLARDDHERLMIQAQAIDRISERYMREAGVGPGMRVLDLGSGMGDCALVVARLTAPDGHVVAVERAPDTVAAARARLDQLGETAIEYVEQDVANLSALDTEPFDAVVMRLLLMHVPDPTAVLRDAAALLRPGGLVVAMDYDLGAITCHPPVPVFERTVHILREAMARAGVHTRMGVELHGAFLAAGLPAPRLRSEQDVGATADWIGFDNFALVMRSLLPVIEATGTATAAELDVDTLADRLRAELIEVGGVAGHPPLVGAWARIPD